MESFLNDQSWILRREIAVTWLTDFFKTIGLPLNVYYTGRHTGELYETVDNVNTTTVCLSSPLSMLNTRLKSSYGPGPGEEGMGYRGKEI